MWAAGHSWLIFDLAKAPRKNNERATSLLLAAQDQMPEDRGEPKGELKFLRKKIRENLKAARLAGFPHGSVSRSPAWSESTVSMTLSVANCLKMKNGFWKKTNSRAGLQDPLSAFGKSQGGTLQRKTL